ncbi:MAG: polysaccharide deacetylase family protein [Pseudomonadota bacterium]
MRPTLVLMLSLLCPPGISAADHAVVLVYHHVSEDTPPVTSVSPEVFEKHLQYLEDNEFNVWPLSRIVDYLQQRKLMPENTVAITFDDAFESVYDEALPRMQKRGWPFTLFVSSEPIDRGFKNYLSWNKIRKLAAKGVEIANHSHSHAHLVRRHEGESKSEWQIRVSRDIDQGSRRIEEETGQRHRIFAYPYGEYSPDLQLLLKQKGYFGIAQQSGAMSHESDFLALPRFPMSTGYAKMSRLAISVNARALPVKGIEFTVRNSTNGAMDQLRFNLKNGAYRIAELACYSAIGGKLQIEDVGEQTYRLLLAETQRAGRNKVNCTAPSSEKSGEYFWHSFQWLVKNPDGSWYRE